MREDESNKMNEMWKEILCQLFVNVKSHSKVDLISITNGTTKSSD